MREYPDENYDAFSDGFEKGYDKGEKDGYARGRESGYIAGYTAKLQHEKPEIDKCPKCGITLSNPMGYVCHSPNCPITLQATC